MKPRYRRILVAVDGSASSRAALAQAIYLARQHRARLRVLHVIEDLGPYMQEVATPEAFWQAMRKSGSALLAKSAAQAAKAGVRAETKMVELPAMGTLVRHAADAIVGEARRGRADLVVVGTHGRRGLVRLLVGSVAEGVLRDSLAPVLLVRA